MSAAPSSPSAVSALSPSSRERIAANKRRAEQRLASRDRQLQQQQALFRDYLHNGSPARASPPPPSIANGRSERDVIVLDDDDDDSHRGAARPLFSDDSQRRVDRVQLTAAEREERRFDGDDDWDDSAEGDIDASVVQQQPRKRHDRAQSTNYRLPLQDSSHRTSQASQPPPAPAALTQHLPPSARGHADAASSTSASSSSRQGGSNHYLHFRSKGIDESSFTTLEPLPHSYRDTQPRTTLSHTARHAETRPAASLGQPLINPFTSAEPTYRVSLSSAAAAKPLSSVLSAPPSLASSISQQHRSAVPHVPPHRQHELRSEEENQLWALFDKAKHPSHSHRPAPTASYVASSSALRPTSSYNGEGTGSGVRKLPSVFDSVSFRLEERQDKERKRKKKEHPLLEERRNAKRLRTTAPIAPPSAPSPSSTSAQSSRFSNPPPPSASRFSAATAAAAASKSHRKTQLLVDPRVAAAERAREERQQRLQQERLTEQRLKPSLDELHSTVLSWRPLQLDTTVRASLEKRFVRVPLTFADDVEYQTVFYPLLLEECRAEMMATMDEMEMAQEERAAEHTSGKHEQSFNPRGLLEVMSIVSYEKVNAFHHIDVDRVDFDSTKRPSLFTTDDLVLLWYRPSPTDPFEPNEWKTASLHTLARLERVHDREEAGKKTERRKPGVHYKLQVYVEQSGTATDRDDGSVDSQKLIKFLLRTGSQWGVVKVMTLITVHRQYRALQSCHMLSLFPFLMQPASSSTRDKSGTSATALSTLRQFPSELIQQFNPSQREAMATAIAATDGITLIQGPPGQPMIATAASQGNCWCCGLCPLCCRVQVPARQKRSSGWSTSCCCSLPTMPNQRRLIPSLPSMLPRPRLHHPRLDRASPSSTGAFSSVHRPMLLSTRSSSVCFRPTLCWTGRATHSKPPLSASEQASGRQARTWCRHSTVEWTLTQSRWTDWWRTD